MAHADKVAWDDGSVSVLVRRSPLGHGVGLPASFFKRAEGMIVISEDNMQEWLALTEEERRRVELLGACFERLREAIEGETSREGYWLCEEEPDSRYEMMKVDDLRHFVERLKRSDSAGLFVIHHDLLPWLKEMSSDGRLWAAELREDVEWWLESQYHRLLKELPSEKNAAEVGELQRKGRPRVDELIRLFADPEMALSQMELMKKLIRGKKGKRAALVVTCFWEEGWLIEKPTYEQITMLCGDIGNRSGYYNQLGKVFPKSEKDVIKQQMRG